MIKLNLFSKNIVDVHLVELIESLKVIIPQCNVSNSEDVGLINENMENLNLTNNFFWFQQNSKNIYTMCLSETDWLLTENKDNYVAKEMFRVCMIGPEEALITGMYPICKYYSYYNRRNEWIRLFKSYYAFQEWFF